MAETDATAAAPNGQDQPKITSRIIGQFIRDLSFENVMAQKGVTGEVTPEITVQVNLDAKKRPVEKQYEVTTKLKIMSKAKGTDDTLFVIELDYTGVFLLDGMTDQQLHPYLYVECPRLIFPFVRRVVSDVTRDGGFPPLNLDTIDFLSLYRQELQRRVEAQKAEGSATA